MEDQEVSAAVRTLWKERGHRNRLPIRGRSMSPLLQVGDEIEVIHTAAAVRFGAIILFERNSVWVAHRVIGRIRRNDRTFVLEKGDAAPTATMIPIEDVQGRVVARWRNQHVTRLDTKASQAGGVFMAVVSRCHWMVERVWPQARRPAWMQRWTAVIRQSAARTLSKERRKDGHVV